MARLPERPGSPGSRQLGWKAIGRHRHAAATNHAPTMGPVERVVVEGYVKTASTDGLDIGQGRMALGAQVNARQRAELREDREQRVRVTGVRGSDDRITVERVDVRQSVRKASPLQWQRRGRQPQRQIGRCKRTGRLQIRQLLAKTKAETTARAEAPRAVAERQKRLPAVAAKRKALVVQVVRGSSGGST